MNVLCLSCGKVHDSKDEQKACTQAHGGMRHVSRWGGRCLGDDLQEYLGEGFHYVARRELREPLPNEELDFEDAA